MQKGMVVRGSGAMAVFNRQLPRYFTFEEIRKIIEQTQNQRDRLLLEVLWQTGGRISEVLQLTPGAIDFTTDTIRLPTLKRRRPMERAVPAKSGLLGLLAKFIASNKIGNEDRLFTISRFRAHQIVRKACRAAGIEDKRAHAHSFRHSLGVHLIQRLPVTAVREILGHSNLDSTLVYTQLVAKDVRRYFDDIEF